MPARNTIVVFARLPEQGTVKTRLLGELSPRQAAELHRACLDDTLRLVDLLSGCDKVLLLAPPAGSSPAAPGRFAPEADWQVGWQRGPDLGARMENAFQDQFCRGAQKAVIVGTDSPWMGRERIRLALNWLDSSEVVVGPAEDGGYYLIGARRLVPKIFRGIPWSTPHVLDLTLRELERIGTRYRLLPRDFDLDRPQDLRRVTQRLRCGDARAENLARWLAKWKTARRSSRRQEPSRPSKRPPPARA